MKKPRKVLFKNVLKLLRLETQKFTKMLELVESLAWQQLEEDIAPKNPTAVHHERLFDYVPWTFFPEAKHKARYQERRKFQHLKDHLRIIQKTLEDAEMKK